MVADFAHTWSRDQANGYLGQSVRSNLYPLTPNDLINAGKDGRYEFRIWSAKIHGTYAGPWDVRITPFLRHQSGQPFGRTFPTTALNYAPNVRILAEPIGTRRMDNITLLDVRVEKGSSSADTAALQASSMSSTCSTTIRSRTRTGRPGCSLLRTGTSDDPPSYDRSASCRPAWRGSV